jgi:hypothetical protein
MKDVKNHLRNVIRSVLREERGNGAPSLDFNGSGTSGEIEGSLAAEMVGASEPIPKTRSRKYPDKKDHRSRMVKFH